MEINENKNEERKNKLNQRVDDGGKVKREENEMMGKEIKENRSKRKKEKIIIQ